MISVPSSIQAQLGETISVIADSDFWVRWDTLVDVSLVLYLLINNMHADFLQDLVGRLTEDNAKINIGVLEVAHSIFKRWRPLFASDDLYTEINHVLAKFGPAFVHLLAVCTPIPYCHTPANYASS
jgi:exportin-2 (importin alpha re-exporter)